MLEKKYNHKVVEENHYNTWLEKGYFEAKAKTKEPFCIVIPPPNVTGKLHLGHAWDTALQDIIIRYKRMQGFDALWLPGMDHAGIATQAKIDKRLKDLGYSPREMDRDEWMNHAWNWKEEYANFIHEQWAKLGLSLDYTRERFTLDEGLNNAVNKVFISLYEKGLIYRGERIINWDPLAMTALSNEEVIYKDIEGYEHYFKYCFVDSPEEYLTIMTTRPETIFGDGAIAVHPDDERYKDIVGKKVITPIANNIIPIIADSYVSIDKGSGCVKITPAHDPNDFEVGKRHDIKIDVVIEPNAQMSVSELVPERYQGLDRYEARKMFIKDAKEQDLLLKMDKIIHSVGHSERTDVVVEPYLSKQWFVKMKPLADKVLENQKSKDSKVNFVPTRFEKIMNHWMGITYDWCISRQLWWGHRIPAWYKGDEVFVGLTPPSDEWIQDPDVLDTWFSSALWPFSTLGWPDETEDLKRYYPNNVLVTGYDIIFFWVCRMVFQGLEFMEERPFKDCLIHGLIRDKLGRKLSKSLGNGVDPMEIIEKYGADSLRYFLATAGAPGQDIRYDEEKVASTWNFINKLWNASRFVLMNLEDFKKSDKHKTNLTYLDKWILSRCNKVIKDVTLNMEKYEFNNVASSLYSFIWDDFCDNYIELSKASLNSNVTKTVLLEVLTNILKMLHPFMPYVTEEIYQMLPINTESIMISDYPKYNEKEIFTLEEETVSKVIEDLTAIRNLKANNNITKEANIVLIAKNEVLPLYKTGLKILDEKIVNNPVKDLEEYKYVSNFIDITYYEKGKEINKDDILKEIENLEKSISKRKSLLSNENYINKAPSNVVEMDKAKLKEEEEKLLNLKSLV